MDDVLDELNLGETFSSKYWRWQLSESEPVSITVEEELARRLPHIDAASWPERFMLGGVYVAGRPAELGCRINPPCRLEYYEPNVPVERIADAYPQWREDSIIYRDPDLAVVVKPAGLPTTPARDQNRFNLQGYLEAYLGSKVHLPSRLDMPVMGVLLVSLSSRMNRHLQRAYDARRVMKHYLCQVSGSPEWSEISCRSRIARDPRHPVLRRCTLNPCEGDAAQTSFCRVLAGSDGDDSLSLLRAQPLSGRTHQIRLHCAELGYPIVGDQYYGGVSAESLRLISYELGFYHPYRMEAFRWTLPESYLPPWAQGAAEVSVGGRF